MKESSVTPTRRKVWPGLSLLLTAITLGLLSLRNLPAFARHQDSIVSQYMAMVFNKWPVPTPTPGPGRLLAIQVLYSPIGMDPDGEWVAVFNAGGRPLELAGYKIGDEETRGQGEGMFRFPDKTKINPGQVLVVANRATQFHSIYAFSPDFELENSSPSVPDLIKYPDWSNGSMNLGNTGDEVLLLNPQDEYLDVVSWGNSQFSLFQPPVRNVAAGHSIARRPANQDTDSAIDWKEIASPVPGEADLSTPTPTVTPTPVSTLTDQDAVMLLISEVYPHPFYQSSIMRDWIEIYNPNPFPVSLQTYSLGDAAGANQKTGQLKFPVGSRIEAGQFAVVAGEAGHFASVYGFLPDFEIFGTDASVPDMVLAPVWQDKGLDLDIHGGDLVILNGQGELVDAVSWGTSTWSIRPSIQIENNHSAERYPSYLDTNTIHDWRDQAEPNPGREAVQLQTATPSATPSLYPPSATPTNSPTPTPTATSTGTTTPTPTPTPTITAAPGINHLLISEIFYNAYAWDDYDEWVEIYNPLGSAYDLSTYKIGDAEEVNKFEGLYQFPSGAFLPPGGRVVVALDADVFSSLYQTYPSYEITGTNPDVPNLVPFNGLGNDGPFELHDLGDEVLILDGQNTPVDVVTYGIGAYPGVISRIGVPAGHSLERYPAWQDSDDCSQDFRDNPAPNPGE